MLCGIRTCDIFMEFGPVHWRKRCYARDEMQKLTLDQQLAINLQTTHQIKSISKSICTFVGKSICNQPLLGNLFIRLKLFNIVSIQFVKIIHLIFRKQFSKYFSKQSLYIFLQNRFHLSVEFFGQSCQCQGVGGLGNFPLKVTNVILTSNQYIAQVSTLPLLCNLQI